jgi:hypothetical protein
MSPHALDFKNGKLHTLCYQFGGESSTGLSADSADNWRCMAVAQLEGVQIMGRDVQSVSHHSRLNTCIDEVVVEVDY